MKKISFFISEKTKNKTNNLVLDEKTVFFVFNRVILEEFGRRGLFSMKPVLFKNKKIFIETKNSVWSSELWINKDEIVSRINIELGGSYVEGLVIKKEI